MSEEPWDQEAEHQHADFLHMLERMQQDYEEKALSDASESLDRTVVTDVPAPGTAHPALARHAEAVRRSPAHLGYVRIPVIRAISAAFTGPDEMIPTSEVASSALTLTRGKCAGPAPFVGDPRREQAFYAWPVWTDEYGRHIAGEAELQIAPRW